MVEGCGVRRGWGIMGAERYKGHMGVGAERSGEGEIGCERELGPRWIVGCSGGPGGTRGTVRGWWGMAGV